MMLISWRDVGHTKKRGDWTVNGQTVQVDVKHIEVWEAHPTAVFNTVFYKGTNTTDPRLLLTTWSVPEEK
jgi:hypothetical protein